MCPAPLVLWGVCGVCCFVVFVGGFSGGVTPGPFPNPEAKPACADGTAPGRVWESRSLPASFFVVEGVWVRGLVDCPVWMVGRFLCLRTLFLRVVFTHNSPHNPPHRGGSRVAARHREYRGRTRDPKPGGTGGPAPSPVRGRPGPGDGRVSAFRHGCVTVSSQGFPWMTGVHGDYQLP